MPLFFMDHAKHGAHVAYTPEEVKRLEAQGWKRREAVQAPAEPAVQPVQPVQDAPATLHLPKRRGRPPANRGA